MSGRKSNPYRTTGKPEKATEPVKSPPLPARRFNSKYGGLRPGAVAVVGGKEMPTDEMEFGTEEDLSTNVGRRERGAPDPIPETDIEVKPAYDAAAAKVAAYDEEEHEVKPAYDEEDSKPPSVRTPSVRQRMPDPESQQQPTTPTGADGQNLNSVTAVLVDQDEEERRIAQRLEDERKDIPLAEPVKEIPWWKRQSTICIACLLLLVIIIVAVTVPLTRQDDGETVNVPTFSPTASPAPTALAAITLVIQLDDKPQETGWTLECDGGTVEDAPTGTYGLLDGRPNFRIEYPAVVTAGADCQLTLLDTAGDGFNPGSYAIYNGQGVGAEEDLIASGTNTGAELVVSFTPGSSAPLSPTAAPTAGDTAAAETLCTVCPDGTPVPRPEAEAAGWGMTCEELEFLAAITTNPATCRNMQDQAAFGCGCRNFCTTMCPDGSDIDPANADDTVFVRFGQPVTCEELQTDIESARSNSQDQCLSANFLGEDVCGCPQTGPFCRICEGADGNTNPSEEALLTEVVPGVNCLDVTGIAYTLKRDDPRTGFSELCPACLSIGAYCGCEVPSDGRPFCRLCGGPTDILPEPTRLVDSSILGYRTTCYHAEFISNINDKNVTEECPRYRDDAAEVCCTP